MKKADKVVGAWRITGMEVSAHITTDDDLAGSFQFGLVQGHINA